MRAELPYHFCSIAGCREMVPKGVAFCAIHAPTRHGDADLHFPDIESLPCAAAPADCKSASQETTNDNSCRAQHPVTGDAGPHEEPTS